MFRRREDSLFDNANDPSQLDQEGAEGAVMAGSQPSSAGQSFNNASSSFGQQPAAQQQPAPRPVQENRPAQPAAQPASSFRPAATPSATSDLNRNRMPEAKPASSFSAPTSSAASTFMPPLGDKGKGAKRVLTVGNDILLKGEIATCDRLVIEGKVDATLNDVHTVEIAEHGSFKGAAQIEDAEISGLFEGELIVRNRLVIYATGRVRGKITYGEIEIERGGELTGEIKTTTTQSATVSTRRNPKDEKVAA